MTYTYNPSEIGTNGKDKMRFELGDTVVEGGEVTCILSDEEYESVINAYQRGPKAWVIAKLKLLEAICRKLSYEVDTKIDVANYGFGDRAQLWKDMYEELKRTLSTPLLKVNYSDGGHYFYAGMLENNRAKLRR